jgi:hypothetical protein
MRESESEDGRDDHVGNHAGLSQHEVAPAKLTVPLAVVGFLVLLAVTLACLFYVAAQIVQTP